jgi:hypothetical protein
MRPSDISPSTESNPSPKRSDTLASAGIKILPAKELSNDQVTIRPFKAWNPPRMKTGLRNHPIGRKVSVITVRDSP